MAPITTASNEETHAALLDALDMHKIHKPFRNPNWKPPQRRNKNLKQILSEAQRAQQSMVNTQQNSGASTPFQSGDGVATDGSTTPSPVPQKSFGISASSNRAIISCQAEQRVMPCLLSHKQHQPQPLIRSDA